jgi:tRNA1Val (adenine37-N6)-methyltransferase
MTGGAGLTGENRDLTIARHEVLCNIGDVAGAASRALRFGGHLYLVHRPHRLGDIFHALACNGLGVKRMRMVHPFAEKEANMVLIDAAKGGRMYVHVEKPLIIYRETGVYTEEVRALYG